MTHVFVTQFYRMISTERCDTSWWYAFKFISEYKHYDTSWRLTMAIYIIIKYKCSIQIEKRLLNIIEINC